MSSEIKVDNKGRILLPSAIRKRLDIKAGDILQLKITRKEIIIKKVHDPFEKLDQLIGKVNFDIQDRKKYEDVAIDLVKDNDREISN